MSEEISTSQETTEGSDINLSGHEQNDVAERLFTQEEVNALIKRRLSKIKSEVRDNEEVINQRVTEAVSARTAELNARESRIACREYIMEKGYPSELIETLNTDDVDLFKKKADSLSGAFRRMANFVAPLGDPEPILTGKDPVKEAFTSGKHIPKDYRI